MPIKGVSRAPHREGCGCVVCKKKREKIEVITMAALVEPEVVAAPQPKVPTEVRLDSLNPATKFVYKGEEHSLNEQIEGYVVCYNLFTRDIVTLGSSTMVEPI